MGWNMTEMVARSGCDHGISPRLLNGTAGVSPNMALAVKGIAWSTAPITECWKRRAMSLNGRAGTEPPPSGAQAHSLHDPNTVLRCGTTIPNVTVRLLRQLPADDRPFFSRCALGGAD